MNNINFKAIVEGLLFAAGDEGLSIRQLKSVLELDKETVHCVIDELKYDYEHGDRGIMLVEAKGIYHLATKPEHTHYFQKLMDSPQASKLSQAALETLAIIAYNQPITRTEIEDIRGVKSDRPLQTLLSRALIEEVGRKEGIGRPIMFGTSVEFLTYFGLRSIEELPPLPENITDTDVSEEADLFFNKFENE
ncbi:Segregation and condensation protein B [Paraliobacillus sp. PM-2]|uniref:SMC-Scp complex subunit ScpB n=1 Tax=Paraliobacillus sp. PM-2 TaxID=1462524 RepID=UPI00061B97A8|nr:SMC-Scp complex subunit ScpB [Paraliobacillus sp. PM-2]CQR46734.1 Segregation and condensation protein B [Paraliobacillus sp. PM-2]